MRFVFLSSLMVSAWLFVACDTTCPVGMQRYGRKCVDSPTVDAGRNAQDGAVGESASSAGDGDSAAGDATQGMRDGGPVAPDAGDDSKVDSGAGPCLPPSCDPCATNPCLNDGLCSPTATGYMCACKVGFSGPTCAADVCQLDPCAHGACTRKSVGRTCNCDSGWSGEACETNTNAALANLTVSAGALFPAFKANVYAYSVDLGISAPEIAVTPTAAVPDGVEVKIDGLAATSGVASELYVIGLNTSKVVSIEVQADDGTKLTYAVTVRRSLVQQAYVKRRMSATGDGFGDRTLAIHGETAAVGVRERNKIQLLTRELGSWALASYEVGLPQAYSAPDFGAAVALTADWLVVGAYGDNNTSGMAYAIRRSTIASGTLEVHAIGADGGHADRRYGSVLAADHNTIVVGAPGETVVRDGTPRERAGAAYVFEFDGNGWGVGQRLTSPTALQDDQFGARVALDDGLLAIGAICDDGASVAGACAGAVYVFQRRDGWESAGVLRVPGSSLLGSGVGVAGGRIAAANGRFCYLSCQGQPDAYVFSRTAGEWRATSVSTLPRVENTPAVLDPVSFGMAGLAFDGKVLVISAAGEDLMARGVNPSRDPGMGEAADAGAVYVFVEHADGWHMDAYIKASNAEAGDGFGAAVAGADGTWLVGAPREDSDADGMNGDQSGNTAPDSGAVYLFSTNCANVPTGASVPGC